MPPKGAKPILNQTTEPHTSNSDLNQDNFADNPKDSCDPEIRPDNNDKGVNLSEAAWRFMEKLINNQVSLTVERQTKQINERIDSLSSRIEGIRDGYEGQINEIKEKLTNPDLSTDEAQNLRLVAVETKVKMFEELQTEKSRCDDYLNYHHLIAGVAREQRSREWSLRLYNWQSPWTERELDAEGIYSELIQPVLQQVIASGEPSYPTGYFDVIERAHPLASRRNGIAPWIFRFHSRKCLYDFMLNKKSHMDSLVAKAANKSLWCSSSAVKYDPKKICRVAHDLAPVNRRTMSFLHQTGLASRCKTTSVGVSFKAKGVKSGWVQVTNPFSPTLEGLVTPLPQISSLLSAKSIICETFAAADRNSFIKNLKVDIQAICRLATERQSEAHEDGDEFEPDEDSPAETAKSQPEGESRATPAPAAAAKKRQAALAAPQPSNTRSEAAKKSAAAATVSSRAAK